MPGTITWQKKNPIARGSETLLEFLLIFSQMWYWAAFYIVSLIPIDSASFRVHQRRYFKQSAVGNIDIQTRSKYRMLSSNRGICVTPPNTRLNMLLGRRSDMNVKVRDQRRPPQNSCILNIEGLLCFWAHRSWGGPHKMWPVLSRKSPRVEGLRRPHYLMRG